MAESSVADNPIQYPLSQAPDKGAWLEVHPGIYWLRFGLPIALDHINVYLLDDGDGYFVVDTGMQMPDTKAQWQQHFSELMADKPLKGVIVTHLHPDHVGLAGWLCETFRCPLYMSMAEYFAARCFTNLSSTLSWTSEQFFSRQGLGPDYLEFLSQRMAGYGAIVATLPGAYQRLSEGDELSIGGRQWRIVVGNGHSPEHVCLYNEAEKLLISGDQLIAKISSNVSVMSIEPEGNPLQDWFDSLDHLNQLDAKTLVMASHDKPFYGLKARVEQLKQHHYEHLEALLLATQEPQKALDLLPVLFKRKIGFSDMGMALGECIAHLHYLMAQAKLSRSLVDGVYYYQAD